MVLPCEQPKLSPWTEFGLPPHTTALPTTAGRCGYIFVASFHVLYMFIDVVLLCLKRRLNLSAMVLPREGPKLSPQTEFGLLPCTTTLPTSMGSGMFILKVRFNFLHVFRSCFFYYIWSFFQQHTFCARMGKVKTQPTDWVGLLVSSQPRQHWEAAAGMFWGWVVSSFTFFSHVCYCIWFLF